MAVEWTITIEGKNQFKSWERLFDGCIGLSIEDGKTIMTALQGAVVAHEAETYCLFRRVCPDCHTFRPVKDYTSRRIRTVLGTVEVRNPRWMLCRDCHRGMDGAFAPLKEICPDRATPELLELTAAVNSLVGKRMAKKQQMRWSLHGANMLMQVRTAEANGELRDRLRTPFRQPEANLPTLFKPKPPLLHAA